MRDDFNLSTKGTIAKRVNFLCSNPNCRKLTTGPSKIEDKSVNVGVAAHISAASRGGCRYDSSLLSEERKSAKNGIWLCQTCSKLIDSDEEYYTKELLQQWKDSAEKFAQNSIASTNQSYLAKKLEQKQIFEKLETMMPICFQKLETI